MTKQILLLAAANAALSVPMALLVKHGLPKEDLCM